MIGLLFTGAYILKGIKKVLHGPLNEHWAHGEHKLTEINTREIIVVVPLMVLILVDRHLARVDLGSDQQSRCGICSKRWMMNFPILSVITFLPFVAAVIMLLMPADRKT